MKKVLLIFLLSLGMLSLEAQRDTTNLAISPGYRNPSAEHSNISVSIYPVPVRENYFTIKTDREFTFIKITNIIGQDIFRAQFNNPLTYNKVFLDNPKRGMYLVTILFSDGSRIVRKIMIEQTE